MRRSFIFAFCLSTLAALGAYAQTSISMTADKTSIVAGDAVTYTIVVTNNGSDAVTDVRVSNPLILNSYLNFIGPGCSGNGEIVCTAPSIGAGGSASVTVSVRYFGPGTAINTATLTSDPAEPTASVTVTVTPRTADLVLTASNLNTTIAPGGVATYRVTVKSIGPDVAENVLLSAYLPSGATVASVPIGCADSHSAIQCLFGALSPNAPIPLVLGVRASQNEGPMKVDFSLFTTDVDTDLSNNGASLTVNVVKPALGPNDADLGVTLVAGTPSTTNGDINVTATISNFGPNPAAHARLDFLISNEDVMITNTTSPNALNCTYGLGGASCTFTSMGATAVIPITFTVHNSFGAPISSDFQAHVESATADHNPGNNDALVLVSGN